MEKVNCPKCGIEVDVQVSQCPQCEFKVKQYFTNLKQLKKENEEKARQHLEEVRKQKKEKEEQEKRAREEQRNRMTRCITCDYSISKRADHCPRCGEPCEKPEQPAKPEAEAENKFNDYIDLNFTKFLTPRLVKIVYLLTIVVGGLMVIGSIIGSFLTGRFSVIIPAVITYAISLLFTRIICESALILFKIEENSRK